MGRKPGRAAWQFHPSAAVQGPNARGGPAVSGSGPSCSAGEEAEAAAAAGWCAGVGSRCGGVGGWRFLPDPLGGVGGTVGAAGPAAFGAGSGSGAASSADSRGVWYPPAAGSAGSVGGGFVATWRRSATVSLTMEWKRRRSRTLAIAKPSITSSALRRRAAARLGWMPSGIGDRGEVDIANGSADPNERGD